MYYLHMGNRPQGSDLSIYNFSMALLPQDMVSINFGKLSFNVVFQIFSKLLSISSEFSCHAINCALVLVLTSYTVLISSRVSIYATFSLNT